MKAHITWPFKLCNSGRVETEEFVNVWTFHTSDKTFLFVHIQSFICILLHYSTNA